MKQIGLLIFICFIFGALPPAKSQSFFDPNQGITPQTKKEPSKEKKKGSSSFKASDLLNFIQDPSTPAGQGETVAGPGKKTPTEEPSPFHPTLPWDQGIKKFEPKTPKVQPPLTIRTDTLTVTGIGSLPPRRGEPISIRTDLLTVTGTGALPVREPFEPISIRTQTLTIEGIFGEPGVIRTQRLLITGTGSLPPRLGAPITITTVPLLITGTGTLPVREPFEPIEIRTGILTIEGIHSEPGVIRTQRLFITGTGSLPPRGAPIPPFRTSTLLLTGTGALPTREAVPPVTIRTESLTITGIGGSRP